MDGRIRVEIHATGPLYLGGCFCITVAMIVLLTLALQCKSLWAGLAFCLLTAGFIGFVYIYEKRPTVIWSDGETLRWHHLCGTREVRLSAIRNMQCTPYKVHTRYATLQRIRLTLYTEDDMAGGVEFNDSVKTEDLLREKMDGTPTQVPLLELYAYLCTHGCGKP